MKNRASHKKVLSAKDLRIGGRYLHKNGSFIREIERVEGQSIYWRDQSECGRCSKTVFLRSVEREAIDQDGIDTTAFEAPHLSDPSDLLRRQRSLTEKAKLIAMIVRNAMEDFHCEHLSDDQMKELNPIIRDGVFTALSALETQEDSAAAGAYLALNELMIPSYWEAPELLEDFSKFMARYGEKAG